MAQPIPYVKLTDGVTTINLPGDTQLINSNRWTGVGANVTPDLETGEPFFEYSVQTAGRPIQVTTEGIGWIYRPTLDEIVAYARVPGLQMNLIFSKISGEDPEEEIHNFLVVFDQNQPIIDTLVRHRAPETDQDKFYITLNFITVSAPNG